MNLNHLITKHRLEVFVVLFLVVVAVLYFSNRAKAQPPFDVPGPINPTCDPLDTDCFVRIFPDETGNAGNFLTTDGSTRSWVAVGGGAFSTTSNVTSNAPGTLATDDFVFGSSQLDDDGNADNRSRFFFDKDLSAFRAGIVTGTEWDTVNVGVGSFATGVNTIASGLSSTATGRDTRASGNYSTTMGTSTTASGNISTAMGTDTTAQAFASLVIGRFNIISGTTDSWVSTDPLFVIGNGTGPGAGDLSNALTVLKSGNVGIGTENPSELLDVAGHIAASGPTIPNSNLDGSCGSGATIDGTDTAGVVTMGGGTILTCKITFNVSYSSVPVCVVTPQSSPANTFAVSPSKVSFEISSLGNMEFELVQYICIGR